MAFTGPSILVAEVPDVLKVVSGNEDSKGDCNLDSSDLAICDELFVGLDVDTLPAGSGIVSPCRMRLITRLSSW